MNRYFKNNIIYLSYFVFVLLLIIFKITPPAVLALDCPCGCAEYGSQCGLSCPCVRCSQCPPSDNGDDKDVEGPKTTIGGTVTCLYNGVAYPVRGVKLYVHSSANNGTNWYVITDNAGKFSGSQVGRAWLVIRNSLVNAQWLKGGTWYPYEGTIADFVPTSCPAVPNAPQCVNITSYGSKCLTTGANIGYQCELNWNTSTTKFNFQSPNCVKPTVSPEIPTLTVSEYPTETPFLEPSINEYPPVSPSVAPTYSNESLSPTSIYCPKHIQGDANCDGLVNGIDYSIWLNSQCIPGQGQECADLRADFNGDGDVDDYQFGTNGNRISGGDFETWFNNREN